jgi:6-phosphofructokinase 1
MRLAVLTSGGDAPGMNAAVRAVAKLGGARGIEVFGVSQGYDGLIAGRLQSLTPRDVDAIGHLGGTVLGSARSRRFMTPEGRLAAARKLEEAGVDGLVVIGGNGSLTGAQILAAETGVRVVGVPASIDNDIGCTATAIGVDTALNTIVEACDRISDTARAHRRVFVVEVMGRQCGYLAMASSIAAGADACLYREQGKDEDTVVDELASVVRTGLDPERGKQRVLIIKAEGVEVSTARLVERLQAQVDVDMPGVAVRGTVLGHLVRGGNPTFQDRMVAGRLAVHAVEALMDGASAEMVAWQARTPGGRATLDPWVQRFHLTDVLTHTTELLDGSSKVTRMRVAMMQRYEGVLAI